MVCDSLLALVFCSRLEMLAGRRVERGCKLETAVPPSRLALSRSGAAAAAARGAQVSGVSGRGQTAGASGAESSAASPSQAGSVQRRSPSQPITLGTQRRTESLRPAASPRRHQCSRSRRRRRQGRCQARAGRQQRRGETRRRSRSLERSSLAGRAQRLGQRGLGRAPLLQR